MPGAGRHRRRIRFGLPVAAAGIAAAVTAALMTTSAGAATALPTPTVKPAVSTTSLATLKKRVAGAEAGDDIAGETTKKASLSASTTGTAASPKIIGGTTTTINTAPFMAQLWYYDDKGTTDESDDIGFFCGGSVISPSKILTASHCVKGYNWAKNGAVITSATVLPTTDADGNTDLHGGQATAVLRQWNHPSYNATTIDNDIAVLTLAAPVKATPIRMTTYGDTASYTGTPAKTAKVYGWGRTSSQTEDISETLKTATLPIQSDATCVGAYGSLVIKAHMVCAGTPATGSDTGTTTICNGDSGGPLVVGGRIVGVVSWSGDDGDASTVNDCVVEGTYGVFTKVSVYAGAAYAQVDDGNLSYSDNKADVYARKSSNKVGYELDSKGTSLATRVSLGDWGGVNLVRTADLNRDGYQDWIYRTTAGAVYWDHFQLNSARDDGSWVSTKIFANWKTRTRIIAPGDVTGDYLPDLVSVDSAGVLWIYPGKGNGTFSSPSRVGGGWSQYNTLVGHGDFNGDGKADLLARNKSTGVVYLYKGAGKSGTGAFAARVKVRTWGSYNAFDAVGDFTGDGKADLLIRNASNALYLYPGTGKATSEIFGTPKSLGTGFQQYDIFG
ncbi:trypsin-like serine protease [Streptomyces sp. N50]|uniref:trypsin-like serine protease n=1 Tax=Streptomyces sp. N50 TaxID=3081765 RepID=UPI0029621BD4|nr:trypsin-like serine protease [Streptomyces sp. N50]WOX12590.1 trypsin-like serine protease [Streptomyces sp. N50]